MGRTSSKMNDLQRQINHLKTENEKRKQEIKEGNNQINLLTDNEIIRMLQETNAPYSNKHRFSYEEIAEHTGRSTGYISNLAKEHGLSRRNLKSVE